MGQCARVGERVLSGGDSRRHAPPSRYHLWIAALGGLFFAGDLAAWNTSVLLTSAASATLFGNTSPLWVSLGALFLFKEKLGRGFWAGLGLALVGALIILGENFSAQPSVGLGSLLPSSPECFMPLSSSAPSARAKG